MKFVCFVLADPAHGLGHIRRCEALAQAALQRGHQFVLAANRAPAVGGWVEVQGVEDMEGLSRAVELVGADWLIIDLEERVPEEVWSLAARYGVRTCLLSAVGRIENDARRADVAWVQDRAETVILRRDILEQVRRPSSRWFVFGGSADVLCLLARFTKVCADWDADLLVTDFMRYSLKPHGRLEVVQGDSRSLELLSGAGRACIHMGMTAWELAYFRVPTYVFSATPGHLAFARQMEGAGLVRAYPGVGLPRDDVDFREFLQIPFEPTGVPPDGRGADRLLAILEG